MPMQFAPTEILKNQEQSNKPETHQNEGFSKLQKMIETLVEQMSTMMSLLTTVVTKLVK